MVGRVGKIKERLLWKPREAASRTTAPCMYFLEFLITVKVLSLAFCPTFCCFSIFLHDIRTCIYLSQRDGERERGKKEREGGREGGEGGREGGSLSLLRITESIIITFLYQINYFGSIGVFLGNSMYSGTLL